MLEAGEGRVTEEIVLETFFAVFLAGVDLHAFGGMAPRKVAMGSQSTYLVDAAVVVGLIKLYIGQTLPFPDFYFTIRISIRYCSSNYSSFYI